METISQAGKESRLSTNPPDTQFSARDLQDIADCAVQEAIAADLALPLAGIRTQIDSGAAHAALCADFDAKDRYLVEGSPTFLLDEGRQKLYGNVGYRVIEANIEELFADHGERVSWC